MFLITFFQKNKVKNEDKNKNNKKTNIKKYSSTEIFLLKEKFRNVKKQK